MTRILVIRHGALGDIVLSTGAMAAIRRHHHDAEITLLTTRPYAAFLESTGWFDRVWVDDKPKPWNIAAILRLRQKMLQAGFTRIYDLQTSGRTDRYHWLIGPAPRPEWSGTARGASHRHASPDRTTLHTVERQTAQLAIAGIDDVPPPTLDFVRTDGIPFGLRSGFGLLVPGGSAHRPEKRWPAGHYAGLAADWVAKGLQPVVIGGPGEALLGREISACVPEALDLTGRTGFEEIVGLARGARQAVGNDTGPMHLIAASGCPSLTLFSQHSDPARTAPRGPAAHVLRKPELAELSVGEVVAALEETNISDAN